MDTQGLLLAVAVHAADLQDRDGARLRHRFPRLQHLWADAGYTGPKLETWMRETTDWILAIVRCAKLGASFQALPRCWIVERTFAWLGCHRHLSKDYEGLPETTEAWTHAVMTGLMLRRLARTPSFKHPYMMQWCEQFLRYAGAAIPPGRTGVAEAGMGVVTAHPERMRGGFRAVAARFGPDPGGPAGPAGIV